MKYEMSNLCQTSLRMIFTWTMSIPPLVGDKKWSLFSSLNVLEPKKNNSNFLFMHNIRAAGVAFSKGGNYKMRKVIGWLKRPPADRLRFSLGSITAEDIRVSFCRTGKMIKLCLKKNIFCRFTVTKRFDFFNFSQLFWRDFVLYILKIVLFWS